MGRLFTILTALFCISLGGLGIFLTIQEAKEITNIKKGQVWSLED